MLSNQELLDAIRSTDLRNQLHDLWVPVSAVTANHQKATFDTFRNREEDASDERLAVVRLLENDDLFPQTRAAQSSVCVEGKGRSLDGDGGVIRTFLASGP